MALFHKIGQSIKAAESEFESISEERKRNLIMLSDYISEKISSGDTAKLTFICTHNSRRSHMSQVWAQTAAAYYGIDNVQTYSGGTEATALNPRAAAALKRAGFEIEKSDDSDNPVYRVTYGAGMNPMEVFSKKFDEKPNPREDYCAVMTCAKAESDCPFVPGASYRVSLPYDDPKDFDGTPLETATYDERRRQIAREMLWAFSRIKAH
ncbi:protein-tyrosine-phosphatase [candidate division KSB1 bacterium]